MTVVREKNGNGHAVLTVKTDKGEFILDNQEEKVLLWSETNYRFVKRQAQFDPNRWVSLGDPRLQVLAGLDRLGEVEAAADIAAILARLVEARRADAVDPAPGAVGPAHPEGDVERLALGRGAVGRL